MKTLSAKAYAKINLYLDVVDKRADGYHSIESIMQQISLSDTVTISRTDSSEWITVSCTDPSVPTDRRNIVYRCAEQFFNWFDIADRGVHIHIDKKIPSCGGLAGGSTDGAAVLRLLCELYEINADSDTLCEIGVKVGADIPFCIVGGTCICRGIGEKLAPVKVPSADYLVLISFPGEGISTPEAYGILDTIVRPTDRPTLDTVLGEIEKGEIPKKMYNAFELAILPDHSNARLVKQTMLDFGAVSSMMSGSGSTIFGLFDSEESINRAVSQLSKLGFESHICSPLI